MKASETGLPGVLILEPEVFEDERGFFFESWNERAFERATGVKLRFVQDNHSWSRHRVLRGIHYQLRRPQGKLVRVLRGAVFDVAVDLRRSSVSFGHWTGIEMTSENRRQLWVPPGFGHGFLVLSDSAEVLYKVTDYHAPEHERTLCWDDPDVGIAWPLGGDEPVLSAKDSAGTLLARCEVYP